jgi:hypothetical protein
MHLLLMPRSQRGFQFEGQRYLTRRPLATPSNCVTGARRPPILELLPMLRGGAYRLPLLTQICTSVSIEISTSFLPIVVEVLLPRATLALRRHELCSQAMAVSSEP